MFMMLKHDIVAMQEAAGSDGEGHHWREWGVKQDRTRSTNEELNSDSSPDVSQRNYTERTQMLQK